MGLFTCSKNKNKKAVNFGQNNIITEQQEPFKRLRILLLGTGDSGKSTIIKQASLIHGSGFTNEERTFYIQKIRLNCIEFSQELLKGLEQFNIKIEDKQTQEYINFIDNLTDEDAKSTTNILIPALKHIWEHEEIKNIFKRKNEIRVGDSAEYFLSQIDRVFDDEFIPTNEDILRSRTETTTVSEFNFSIGSSFVSLIDVGGRRSERRKWGNYCQDINAVLFVSSLSEFDQNLYEHSKQNRISESLAVFGEVCGAKMFQNTPIILFLNKKDLFLSKLQTSDLSIVFPEYTGSTDPSEAIEFIKNKFIQASKSQKNQQREIFIHVASATDISLGKEVFSDSENSILITSLKKSGLL